MTGGGGPAPRATPGRARSLRRGARGPRGALWRRGARSPRLPLFRRGARGPRRAPGRLGALARVGLAGAYFAAAGIGFLLPASADAVARGRVWTLLTSALAAQGPLPLLQVAITAAVAALVFVRAGGRTWWRAALAGHVGSALLAYALIGAAIALGSASARHAATQPDYGVSCVLGASLGALLVRRGDRLAIAVGVAGTLALLPLSFGWIGLEHPLAIAIGAAATWHLARRNA